MSNLRLQKKPAVTKIEDSDNPKYLFQQRRMLLWNEVGPRRRRKWTRYYHDRLSRIYRHQVTKGQRVLEIGCGQGDLLAALEPSFGLGVDFSGEMIRSARQRHPELVFVQADAHHLNIHEQFDVIILSDLVNDLWDVQEVLEQVRKLSTGRTRLIINVYSHLWEPLSLLAQKAGIATPILVQNWLTVDDQDNLLRLADFEMVRHWEEILWPFRLPVLSDFLNRYLVKIWPFNKMALTNFIVARPRPVPNGDEFSVSVIVPARNESENVKQIVDLIPEMGSGTEIIFVEGHSKDDTYDAILKTIAAHPERRCKVFRQAGVGKGDAVRLGFAEASGDILMILDADMTVPPEYLPRFYEVIRSGAADFVNGVRLVYPMSDGAMRFFNLLGNKFFSIAFSWLLGQPVKDTLCGTKVLWKKDYDLIKKNREYFGDFDPFGDFDLLFGAAKTGLKIIDLPIRYRDRRYGSTNIQRWSHGWLLLKMVAFAARRIKFV